ncbi:HU family DNA-binding protein [Pseudomonas veronii]|uniref:HU family DNA-binding protein n=1 Tax=Pseudomonas veronii TaxID=76761 RepID=UPI0015A3E2D1|nr:HU family DNA-binding protein [Pseudomonas veronii]NWD57447.1 HU family DNA-binding protein [Pseudomonas veronii]
MNKSELIDAIADSADLSKANATAALNGFIDAVTTALKAKEEVVLVGFGTFKTTVRPARAGRNPSTGKAIQIAEAVVPGFKAGSVLKRSIQS